MMIAAASLAPSHLLATSVCPAWLVLGTRAATTGIWVAAIFPLSAVLAPTAYAMICALGALSVLTTPSSPKGLALIASIAITAEFSAVSALSSITAHASPLIVTIAARATLVHWPRTSLAHWTLRTSIAV